MPVINCPNKELENILEQISQETCEGELTVKFYGFHPIDPLYIPKIYFYIERKKLFSPIYHIEVEEFLKDPFTIIKNLREFLKSKYPEIKEDFAQCELGKKKAEDFEWICYDDKH
jgi:hypothetical protein